jgi:hypothetical protein
VTSLDARALVSEIRRRIGDKSHHQCAEDNIPISCYCMACFLTAALGLIEQQQEEIRGLSQGDI